MSADVAAAAVANHQTTCMGGAAGIPVLVRHKPTTMQRLVGPRPSAVLAPARRRALRPQRTSCVVRAGALDELEDWQRERLQQAAAAGRRQVKVSFRAPAARFVPMQMSEYTSRPHATGKHSSGAPAGSVGRPPRQRQWRRSAKGIHGPSLSQHQLVCYLMFGMQVERVCKELGLPRQAVLAALKELPPPDQ